MNDITPLRSLRQVLAALYPTVAGSLVVLADAGIATQRIAFDPAAETNWHAILLEARRQQKVEALLDVVAADYGANPAFAQARQAFLAWATTPAGQLPWPGPSLDAPSARPVPRPPTAGPLVGRDTFLAELIAELTAPGRPDRHALTALRGLPGVGKTALAKALANDPAIVDAFPDGRAWLELGPTPDLFGRLGQLLQDFGAPADGLTSEDARAARLRQVLDGKRFLLILDDVWQAGHAADFLDAVRPPALAFITTRSRQVASDLHAANHELWVLQPKHAVALLAEAGADAQAAVEAAEQNAYALVEQVGYLPLAVKIAGRRLDSQARVTGPGQAIARLAGELQARLLSLKVAGRRAGIDERELSLEAVIALSYDHLPDGDTQRAFRTLAVFGGQPLDFDGAAAAGLWQIQPSDAGDRVAQLIDAGLLEVAHAGGQARYSLHQTIAAYAAARLAENAEEQHAAELAHARHYASVVAGWNEALNAGRMTYSAPLEWVQVAAALDRLERAEASDDKAASVLVEISRWWRNTLTKNYDRRLLGWLNAAVVAARRVADDRDLANVLQAQGDVLYFLKQTDEALTRYEEALQLFRAVGGRLGEANVLQVQGDVLAFLDQREEALTRYAEALRLYRAVGDRLGEANVLCRQGDVLAFLDQRDEALTRYEEALRLYRTVGDRVGEANVLQAQGDLLAFLDQRDEALTRYEEALRLFRAVGFRLGEANVLQAQGDVLAFLDQRDEALTRYEEALRLYQAVGARVGEANVLKAQGDVLFFLKQTDEALTRNEEALRLYRAVGSRLGEANVLQAQGDVLAFLDQRDEALVRYEEALRLFRAVGSRLGEANVLKAQGDVLAFLDQRDEALTRYEEALRLFRAVGSRLGEANVLKAQGDVALRGGQIETGMGLLEQARQIYQLVGARAGLSNVGIRLARYAASQDDWERAIDLMQPAADFGVEIGHPLGAQLQAEIDEWRSQLQG